MMKYHAEFDCLCPRPSQVFRNSDLDGSFEKYMKLSREEAAFDEEVAVPLMYVRPPKRRSAFFNYAASVSNPQLNTHTLSPYLHAPRFLSFPSTKDPTWDERFPGRSAAEIVTLAPFEWFEPWEDERVMKRGQDYDALKAAFGTCSWFCGCPSSVRGSVELAGTSS